jgi:hypothetical protein
MTAWTDITIGRMVLRETFDMAANISAGSDTRTLVLAGEESYPPLATIAAVQQLNEDILGLQNRLVPIRFGTKSDHDGVYRITDVNTQPRNYQGSELVAFSWGINAERIGPENAVDFESRLAGVGRLNDFGLTGERSHTPPGGAYAYYTGLSQPSGGITRPTSDGVAVTTWRTVPASANPRWAVSLANYGIGRARIKVAGTERVAENIALGASAWVLENGLVSASAAGLDTPIWQSVTNNSATSASATATLPASIVSGDVVVAVLYKDNSEAITPAAGYTLQETVQATGHQQTIFWHRASGVESGTIGFSWATSAFWRLALHRISGCVAAGSPWGQTNSAIDNTATSAVTPPVSLTGTTPNTLLFWGATESGGGGLSTPPTGFTSRLSAGQTGYATKDNTAGGDTGSLTGTFAASGRRTAWLGTLLPSTTPGATLNVANWDGSAWDSTSWNINVGASAGVGLTGFDAATILRNDYEVCTVRLVKDRNPGRTLLDLTLRRGSRFVEGYLQNDASNLLSVYLKTAQSSTATASTGYVVATSNDAQGNKVLVGSARSFTGMTSQGGLNKAATTKLDFYIGAVVGGSAAAAGDAASVLNSHYLTSMSDVTLAALR